MAEERLGAMVAGGGVSDALGVTRRRVLQGAVGAVAATVASRTGVRGQDATPVAASPASIAVYPQPGSRTASPGTGISIRGVALDEIGPVALVGAESGEHAGIWIAHSDGLGASLLPDAAFHPGEEVSVSTRLTIPGSDEGDFTFTVSRPKPAVVEAERHPPAEPEHVHEFRSRPGLRPPRVTVEERSDELAEGLVFMATKRGPGRNGATVMDNTGEPVWFFPVEVQAEEIYDFRAQEYRGEPVLTWWQGIAEGGHGYGHFVIRDSAYALVASFREGNGYPGADLHEFVITGRDTALVLIYHVIGWDLSEMSGEEEGFALDSIVQEIDIATGAVLYEWHSLEHVPLEDAYVEVSQENSEAAFDYFHINSVAEDLDGHLLISARNTWACYKIDRVTGEVIWTLGGKASTFELGEGVQPAYQHDIRGWPDDVVTIFDNGAGPKVRDASRGLRIALDHEAATATLEQAYIHPLSILSYSQGNMQVLPNGNVFMGWGDQQFLSEFNEAGELLQDWLLPEDIHSYRAYRFPWTGRPAEPPSIAAERSGDGDVTVYASWNGATEVTAWQVLAGETEEDLAPTGEPVERAGFETTIPLAIEATAFAVQALDADGAVLSQSDIVEVTEADS